MGIFLGLGEAKLAQAGAGHDLADGVRERRPRHQGGEQTGQGDAVIAHAAGAGHGNPAAALEAVEGGLEQGAEELAHAVGAEVGHQHRVPVAHAAIAADHARRHELVAFAGGVGLVDGRRQVGGALAVALGDGLIGARHPLPALVPIHGEVAPAHRGELEPGPARYLVQQRLGEAAGALGRSVAAVEEGVETDRHAGLGQVSGERRDVPLMGVDAARRDQAHEVAGAAAAAKRGDQSPERRGLR